MTSLTKGVVIPFWSGFSYNMLLMVVNRKLIIHGYTLSIHWEENRT